MTTITKYLITRADREYIMNDIPDWVLADDNYKVTKLSSVLPQESVEKVIEEVEMLQQIYELDEKEIKDLKSKLEEAMEIIEVVHEFCSRDTDNILEAKGVLRLVADACAKWLKPSV